MARRKPQRNPASKAQYVYLNETLYKKSYAVAEIFV